MGQLQFVPQLNFNLDKLLNSITKRVHYKIQIILLKICFQSSIII